MCAQRTLDIIGWRHAEPVLRSLAYALLMHEDGNPAERMLQSTDRGGGTSRIVDKIRNDWRVGEPDQEATSQLLRSLRSGSYEDAADAVIEQLNRGSRAIVYLGRDFLRRG